MSSAVQWLLVGLAACALVAWLGYRAYRRAEAKRLADARAEGRRRMAEEQVSRPQPLVQRLSATQELARVEAARRRAQVEAAQAEAARIETERRTIEEAERAEAARLQAARLEAARVAAAKAEAARAEAARIAAVERAAVERAAVEQAAIREAALREARRAAAAEAARIAAARPVPAPVPVEVAVPPPPPPPPIAIARKPRDQTVVMVADDSKVVRVKTGRLLEAQRYRVVYAADGLEAAQQVLSGSPDVVITDVDMPGMDGFELTRRVRRNPATANIPVIMITAAEDKHRDEAERAGVSMLLGKPYPEDVLIAHIRRAMNDIDA